jgi:dienelactone hydrolase
VAVTVNVFNQESGGNVVYSEGIGAVQVKNGLYAFRFGGAGQPDLASVLRSSPQAWLEVSVDGAALSRQRLVSVPYALVAKSVGEGGVADVNGVLSLQPQSGTPTAVPGKVVLFAKPDGRLYYQDLNGTETVIGGGSGGGTPSAGSVTLDMLSPEVKGRLENTVRAEQDTYAYDARNVVIAGASAGGHLAALVGTTNGHQVLEGSIGQHLDQSSDVQAIVSYFGAANLTTILQQSTPHGLKVRVPALELLLGGQPDALPDFARLASPVFHVDKNDPPLFLLHGDQDPQMPINQSHELHGAYEQPGLPVRFAVLHGSAHGGAAFFDQDHSKDVIAFLKEQVK